MARDNLLVEDVRRALTDAADPDKAVAMSVLLTQPAATTPVVRSWATDEDRDFLRKAIGWALRQHAHTDPVCREALKHIGAA